MKVSVRGSSGLNRRVNIHLYTTPETISTSGYTVTYHPKKQSITVTERIWTPSGYKRRRVGEFRLPRKPKDRNDLEMLAAEVLGLTRKRPRDSLSQRPYYEPSDW